MDALDKDTMLFDEIFADKSVEPSKKDKFSCKDDSLFEAIFYQDSKCDRDKYNIYRVSSVGHPYERLHSRYPVILIED